MWNKYLCLLVSCLVAWGSQGLLAETCHAQSDPDPPAKNDDPPAEPQKKRQPPRDFIERYNQEFLKVEPLIGDMLPEVEAWDGEGQPFKLSQTRGKYTVLVFGCIT